MALVVFVVLVPLALGGFALVGTVELLVAAARWLRVRRRTRAAVRGTWRAGDDGGWALVRSDGAVVIVRGPLTWAAIADGAPGGAVGTLTVVEAADAGPYRSAAPTAILTVRAPDDAYSGAVPFEADRDAARHLGRRGALHAALAVVLFGALLGVVWFFASAFAPVGCA